GRISEKVDLFFNDKGEIYESKYPQASLAKKLGLQKGDEIVEVMGRPVTYYDQVSTIIKSKPHDSISLKIKRGEQVLYFKQPFKDQAQVGFGPLGIAKEEFKTIQYGWAESIPLGTSRAFGVI
ncbi:MAG: PDZ domain-containing protein, partial [Flammeovirgaceae bacterium]